MPFIRLTDNDCELTPEEQARWEALALGTGQGDPLCCAPDWNLAFHETFHANNRVFYLNSNNSQLLLSECPATDGPPFLTPVEDSWMFGQPLLGFYAVDLLEEALEVLSREYGGVLPAIALSGIRKNHPETLKLYALYSRLYNFYRYRVVTLGSASLSGGVDGWLSRRSANCRAKLKKAARAAREAGFAFERQRPGDADEAAAVYKRMLAVEERSWKGVGKCGMAESPSREFYGNLIKRLAPRKTAYVIFAVLDGADAGFIFGSGSGGVYRGQQFSYVREVGKYSVGNLLQWEKIKWLCERGYRRYDMGPVTGPRMAYKERWTELNREIETWIMRGR